MKITLSEIKVFIRTDEDPEGIGFTVSCKKKWKE